MGRWLPSFVISLQSLVNLNRKVDRIMSAIDDLNAKADQLQASLDAEQAQIAAAVASLQQTIADLTAQLGGGATDPQIQAVIDKLEATRVDLEGTIPDTPAP